MTPLSLTVSRFRSFRQEQRFDFPQSPGLYFMTGDNRAEPRLEGNGAGKSSLWEALVWCLYGKTSRGITAGSAANWEAGKGCSVEFEFEVEEPAWMRYVVRRTWSPNSWTLTNGFGEVQDLTAAGLADMLPLGYESFLHCILLPQGEPLFLDLKAEPKAALFSEVMQLDHWLDYSRRAADAVRDAEAIIAAGVESLADKHGRLAALDVDRIESEHDKWKRNQDRRLSAVADDYERTAAAADDLHDETRGLPVEYSMLPLNETVGLAQDRVKRLSGDLRAAQALAEQAGRALRDAEALGASCPTCKQSVGADAHDHLVNFCRRATTEADEAVQQARMALDVAHEHLDDAIASRDKQQQAVDAARRQLQRLEDLRQELRALDRRSQEIEAERDPYEKMLVDARRDRDQLQHDIRVIERGLMTGREQLELRSAWVKWFKDIRLEQIGSALTELEIETNSAVNAQGLTKWELHFQTDDLRKDGRVSRGFLVFVQSPHNDKPVPWEAWSGGESQRLRVAAQQGLADLIRSRMAVDLPLEVWDEPTQWLSPQGVVDLLDELRARAIREQRQIWIVDHRSLGYGGFDGEARVIKDQDGSRVEWKV